MNDLLLKLLRFHQQGYCCSQMMILLALETCDEENLELVGAVSGLCHGLGLSGGTCGAILGGCCILGLYAGKRIPGDPPDERLMMMTEELMQWAELTIGKTHGGIQCGDILGPDSHGTPNPETCAGLVQSTYEKVMELLVSHGYDPERL